MSLSKGGCTTIIHLYSPITIENNNEQNKKRKKNKQEKRQMYNK